MATLSGYKTYNIKVDAANSLNVLDIELPSDVQTVTGFTLSANRRDLAIARGRLGVRMAGEELVVDGEGAFMYMFGLNHPSRVWTFGEVPIKNTTRQLLVRYQDADVPTAAFSAYVVQIILSYTKQSVLN